MIRFPYYSADIHRSYPLGMVTLDQFYQAIRNPKPPIRETIQRIKQASLDGDEDLRANLKQSLYSFTPPVIVNGSRCYDNITGFTGLLVLDFDKVDPQFASDLKQFLFTEYDFIMACWMSPSSKGVKALVLIPVVSSVDEFKSYHKALETEIMGRIQGYDRTTQNPALPLFMSYDPDILIREEPSQWDKQYIPPIKRINPRPFKITPEIDRVIEQTTNRINKIHDNGHPQLRTTAYLLGGYISSGYINYDTAVVLINSLIETNSYLSVAKKIKGYKKTALTMIDSGMLKPLYF